MYSPGKTHESARPAPYPGGIVERLRGGGGPWAWSPLAIGSQTNGSVIRPAAYCGVVGYKPTHGLISRTGVLALSRPLDTVGVFARSLEDAALLAEPLLGYDDRDPRHEGRGPGRGCARRWPRTRR